MFQPGSRVVRLSAAQATIASVNPNATAIAGDDRSRQAASGVRMFSILKSLPPGLA
jgi:hypothetical protein